MTLALALVAAPVAAQDNLPSIRSDLEREAQYYRVIDVPLPPTMVIEASSFLELPDGRIAVGTRRGDVYWVEGLDQSPPAPKFELFASGLHEVFGLAWHDGTLYATHQAELTRLVDRDGDGEVDRYEAVSDGWGFGGEHEFTFGSRFDRDGAIWIVLCLTGSYTSENPFRGWCVRVTRDGTTTPTCSGIRSPAGIGFNLAGDVFYTENQGPWNGACALKHLRPGGFMGHPIGNPWYEQAPGMGPRPAEPTGGREGRRHVDEQRIPELVPTACVFPYKKMGQCATAILCDQSEGRFGPFTGQLFVTDYTLSLVMRVDLEQVDGVYQGACFPFREGLKTGLIGGLLTRGGQLLTGGSKRGWPVRGPSLYSMERLEWTGVLPFEIHSMRVTPDGFRLRFTRPADPVTAAAPSSYALETFTHHYRAAYGSPEIDQTRPTITAAVVSPDGLEVRLVVEGMQLGHVHELHAAGVRSADGEALLHDDAYYTLNRIPAE